MTMERDEAAIPTVTYYLVLLVPGVNHREAEAYFGAHVEFINRMTAASVVLLGGSFAGTVEGAEGAYLLRTSSEQEASEWAAQDPLITSKAFAPRIVPWHLVGISATAIDPAFAP